MNTGNGNANKDPIRAEPLREPGQSLRDSLDELFLQTVVPWFAVATFAGVVAALEWWRWWWASPPTPILLTALAAVVVSLAIRRWHIARGKAHNLRTGLRGERFTGQLLQSELLPLGYHVFHDCCFEGFNVDHVAIGPGGVFAIETKTRSKPRSDARVQYDGARVTVNGMAPDRDPVAQARAGADCIRRILAEYAGRKTHVRPVVLFPGWFVEGRSAGAETWVLNPDAFVSWIKNETTRLAPEDIQVLAAALARYIRTTL